ncbi:hypothetical protein BU25DRAFT_405368 [Macroventuria anomochaeta]|uniref:Uncharacterized protein n=1 Tax=Macroventuria anomochaeta TaxID=301207 RepID=A0ACB6SIM8_9PLEO|nr:uncharacterized protein BU25DRAFT_405368 [Macroventuria anomochaeta]KAF2633475.1 hypothetical protein BU25DRAFT_405368 [Macroventuria anomochaeta]
MAWAPDAPTLEHYRLLILGQILNQDTIRSIENIMLFAQPPDPVHRSDIDAWWKGEGLDIIQYESLGHVVLVTTTPLARRSAYVRWLRLSVNALNNLFVPIDPKRQCLRWSSKT